MAASRARAARSAPTKTVGPLPEGLENNVSARGIPGYGSCRISSCQARSGPDLDLPIEPSWPAKSGSIASTRLVAPMTTHLPRSSSPSIIGQELGYHPVALLPGYLYLSPGVMESSSS